MEDAQQHELIGTATNQTLAGNPLVSVRAADLASSAGYLLKAVGKSPLKAGYHLGGYLKEMGAIVRGKSSIAPDPKDKRFADPAWQSNFLLRGLLQSYLAGQSEFNRFIESADLPPWKRAAPSSSPRSWPSCRDSARSTTPRFTNTAAFIICAAARIPFRRWPRTESGESRRCGSGPQASPPAAASSLAA